MNIDNVIKSLQKGQLPTPAVICENEVYSWEAFRENYYSFLEQLKNLEFQSIACIIDNSKYITSFLAAASESLLDITLIPAYYPNERIKRILKNHRISKLIQLNDNQIDIVFETSNAPPAIKEPLLGLLTSGTTGEPKCTSRTWKSLTHDIKISEKLSQHTYYSVYPLAHIAGLRVFLISLLNQGTFLLSKSFEPKQCFNYMARNKATRLCCTPSFMKQLLLTCPENQWNTIFLDTIILGGEAVNQQLINQIKTTLPQTKIHHIYGATETGISIFVKDEKEGFPLQLIDNKKLKIIDDELYVAKNTSTMKGYKGNIDDGKTWYATNDIVKIKGERVLFAGRKDDVISIGGYLVNPYMIEEVILSFENVKDALIIPKKNSLVGYILKAVLVKSSNEEDKTFRKNFIKQCKEVLPEFMVPRLLEITDEIPRSPIQKKVRK